MSLGPVVRLWVAVQYDPSLRFYDHMYAAANEHKPHFEHWWTNRLSVVLHDYDRHELLTIAHKQCVAEAANPEDLDRTVLRLRDFVRKVIAALAHGTLKRMGVQLVVYANLGLTFDELTERLRLICLSENDRLQTLTSKRMTDVLLHFDYERDGMKGRLHLTPMTRDQALGSIRQTGEHARLFEAPHQGTGLEEFYRKVPETCMYFDLDVFTEEERGANEWPSFVESAAEHAKHVFNGLQAMVMEEST